MGMDAPNCQETLQAVGNAGHDRYSRWTHAERKHSIEHGQLSIIARYHYTIHVFCSGKAIPTTIHAFPGIPELDLGR